MHKGLIITFADRSTSALQIEQWCREHLRLTCDTFVCPDAASELDLMILNHSSANDVIIVCGKTGLGKQNFAPQTITAAADYEVPGLGERMRRHSESLTPKAALSRCGVWVKDTTLIVAVPGNERAAIENLEAIENLIAHGYLALHDKCKTRSAKNLA